ncbi:MAG TPA: ClpXP protease specificity-enhancing factor [Oceanospirillaceae bacterium]|jgi:stringent starvation protein B|nr:ClpXP protease specificity-enhancing factor [Oceanospirillaceae bacterium]
MTSHRPFMIRALNEWILENNCTPYILVNAYANDVQVPQNYVKDGQIILNVSPGAVQGLTITNDGVEFDGRFGGIPSRVSVPTHAVLGIYAKENGQGMIFDTDDPIPEPPGPGKQEKKEPEEKSKSGRPDLRIVKS